MSTSYSRSFLLISLVIGVIVGSVGASIWTTPAIDQYHRQVTTVTTDLDRVQSTLTALNASLRDAQSHIATLTTTLDETISTLTSLNHSLLDMQATLTSINMEKSTLTSDLEQTLDQVTSLQTRIDDILAITVTQHYAWNYGDEVWYWDLPIPFKLYVTYWERARPSKWVEWTSMANDPADEAFLSEMVRKIDQTAIDAGFDDRETLNFVIAFVQSLPYAVDNVSTLGDDYPKYPIETLFERGGDCEDSSILVAALLNRMGYDVALLLLYNANHCAVGIALDASGSYYEYDGRKYYYVETTEVGWQIGEMPLKYQNSAANIYPINE